MQVSLGLFDAIVLFVSVAVAIAIGLRASGKTDSVEAFLLGNRNLPWWAILGSIVATETSTATVLSLPGQAYGPTGMKFLQIAIGYIVGRSIVVYLLLPLYFQGKLFSAYEVLERKFGGRAKRAASLLFLVTRNVGDGLRLFLAALVLRELVGWPFWASAIAIGGITIVYTYFGGMRSVVWNDCIQLVIYMLGGVATVFIIAANIPGGWEEFWDYARASGKMNLFDFRPPATGEPGSGAPSLWAWLLSENTSFWAALVGGAVLTLGTHGTDQMMVQRYLSARSEKDAARAVFCSGLVVFAQFALFLFIGVQLACFYSEMPFEKSDQVYAHFIIHSFPSNTGLIGLVLAAILAAAMSTLSSSLNASASALLNDFYLPSLTVKPSAKKLLSLTRMLAVGFGVLQIVIGIWATTFDDTVVANALKIAGFSAGPLLGMFMLGVLTSRVGESAALGGGAVGLGVLLGTQFVFPLVVNSWWPELALQVAWPWLALIGSATTFFSGYLLSFVFPPRSSLSTPSSRNAQHDST